MAEAFLRALRWAIRVNPKEREGSTLILDHFFIQTKTRAVELEAERDQCSSSLGMKVR